MCIVRFDLRRRITVADIERLLAAIGKLKTILNTNIENGRQLEGDNNGCEGLAEIADGLSMKHGSQDKDRPATNGNPDGGQSRDGGDLPRKY